MYILTDVEQELIETLSDKRIIYVTLMNNHRVARLHYFKHYKL
jgi:hypothetical protein